MVSIISLEDAANDANSGVTRVARLASPRDVVIKDNSIIYLDKSSVKEEHLLFLHDNEFKTTEPGLDLYRLSNVMVLENSAIVTSSGYLLSDSLGPYYHARDIEKAFSSTLTLVAGGAIDVRFRTLTRRRQPTLYMRDVGEAGFFHFMNVIFPTALFWKDSLSHLAPFVSVSTSFQNDYLGLAGALEEKTIRATGGTCFFDDLYMISGWVRPNSFSGGFFERPAVVSHRLRRFAADFPPSPIRRLYISRRDSGVRSMDNEAEFEWILKSRWGFEALCLAEVSINEQISAFRGAEIVVGLHGAGLANVPFMKSGAKVIEVFPSSRIWPTFRALAVRSELNYGAVVLNSSIFIDVVPTVNAVAELLNIE